MHKGNSASWQQRPKGTFSCQDKMHCVHDSKGRDLVELGQSKHPSVLINRQVLLFAPSKVTMVRGNKLMGEQTLPQHWSTFILFHLSFYHFSLFAVTISRILFLLQGRVVLFTLTSKL